MWIGEFSNAANLSVATVRFYVRSGLLQPRQGRVGGTRPYMEFSQKDLRTLSAIRAGQAMGMSLAEIKLLVSERRAGGMERMLQAMIVQRDKLNKRASELSSMLQFVEAKIRWLREGGIGTPPEPSVSSDSRAMSSVPKSATRR